MIRQLNFAENCVDQLAVHHMFDIYLQDQNR